MTVDHPLATVCPFCGAQHTRAGTPDGRPGPRPRPGDLTLCIRCGEICLFSPTLALRRPTPEEAAELATDPDAQEARRAWEGMMALVKKGAH